MLCSLKQFVRHSLPPLVKLNNRGHPYKLHCRFATANSPDLNPIHYKIWGIIQPRVQSTKVQGVKDLMQRLIDVWAGVEEIVIQGVIDHRRTRHSATIVLNEYSL